MSDFTCHIVGCVQDPGHDPPHHDYRGREIPARTFPCPVDLCVLDSGHGLPHQDHRGDPFYDLAADQAAPSAYEVGGVRMEFPPIEPDEARRRWALEQAVLCYAQPHLYPVKENLLNLADEFIAYVTQEPKG